MWTAVAIEALLVVLALLLAYFFSFYDRRWPLPDLLDVDWMYSLLVGGLLAVLMLAFFVSLEYLQVPLATSLRKVINELLIPLFTPLSFAQITVISLAAGIGEELFFRWCLQGGFALMVHPIAALLMASIIFGVCHWVNAAYAVMATIMGIFLGVTMNYFGITTAIVVHAVYDFLAIIYITRIAAPTGAAAG